MKKGAFIVDRLLPGFVAEAAKRHNIACTSMSDGWVLRLEQGMRLRWVVGYQFDLNTAAASALAQDKVATHLALKEAGIASVEHVLLRSLRGEPLPVHTLEAAFTGPFVVKPLDGKSGRDVRKVIDTAEAEKFIHATKELTWAASPFYEITAEYRVLLLDGAPLVMFEKTEPLIERGLKYYNLGKGAKPAEVLTQDTREVLETMARQTCSALGLRLASVDIVRIDGGLRVIEVNDSITMENYARHSEQYYKNAALAYEAIVATMFN